VLTVFRGKFLIKQKDKRHYPIKATKEEVLLFIRDREWLTLHDLIEQFGYRYKGAERRLYRLAHAGLITPWIEKGQWTLTQDGYRKCEYYKERRKQLETDD